MMKILPVVAGAAAMFSVAQAAPIFTPTDFVRSVQVDGGTVEIGGVGVSDDDNVSPGAETADHAIDGVGQKYLNFGRENTGIFITPDFGPSIVTSMQLWTANDFETRDPASYEIYGTNDAIAASDPDDTFDLSLFTLISAGDLALPESRQAGGSTPLDDANSQTVTFANLASYVSYLIIFPTVKDATLAGIASNSMQIGEIQLFGAEVPIPAALPLFLAGIAGLGFARRKRKLI